MLFDGERFVHTYEGHNWARCSRCRRPEKFMPFDQGLCVICFFYGNGLPVEEFWDLHNQGYEWAPYTIGSRMMKLLFAKTDLR
jgi:hypothetical protein